MWRWIRNVLFAIDVVLLAAVLVLWWHWRTAVDIAALSLPPDGRTQFAASLRGRIMLAVSGIVVDDRRKWCLDWTSGNAEFGNKLFEQIVKHYDVVSAVGLIEYHRGMAIVDDHESGRWWMLVVPDWIMLAVLVPWPANWAWVAIRRKRRFRRGCCPECGYDLRVTPGRCTECGWTNAGTAEKKRRRWPWVVAAVVLTAGVYNVLRPRTRPMAPARIVDVDVVAGPLSEASEKLCRQASLELVLEQELDSDDLCPSLRLSQVDVNVAVDVMERQLNGLAMMAMWVDGRQLHVAWPKAVSGRRWCRVYDLTHSTEQLRTFNSDMLAAGMVPISVMNPSLSHNGIEASPDTLLRWLSAIQAWGGRGAVQIVGDKAIVIADARGHLDMRGAVEVIEGVGLSRQTLQFDFRGRKAVHVALGRVKPVTEPNPLLQQRISLTGEGPVRFKDALIGLADRTRLNVVIDWQRIEAAGVTLDTPITVRFENVPWVDALAGILANTGSLQLGWRSDTNVVFVSTAKTIDSWWKARIYDVRDIVTGLGQRGQTSEEGAALTIIGRVGGAAENPSGWPLEYWERVYHGGRLYVCTSTERHARIEAALARMRAELKQ